MPGKDKKLITFTLYPGVTPLDLVGPLTVLRNLANRSPYRRGGRADPANEHRHAQIIPAKTFGEVPDPFGVIVPGGGAATMTAMRHEPMLAYVRSAAKTASQVRDGSVGQGRQNSAGVDTQQGERVRDAEVDQSKEHEGPSSLSWRATMSAAYAPRDSVISECAEIGHEQRG